MEYTLGLALLDFVPNLAFLAGGYYLVKAVRLVRGRACSRMCMAGALLVFSGGILKATWKLIYTLGLADIQWMSQIQFVLLAPGFLALLVTAIRLARAKPIQAPGAVLAMAAWKIPFLAVMTLSSLGAQGILTYICFQRKLRLAASLFIVAVLCMLGMSGMGSAGEQSVMLQWIEESINSVGQIAFAFGSFLLYTDYAAKWKA